MPPVDTAAVTRDLARPLPPRGRGWVAGGAGPGTADPGATGSTS